MNIKRAISRVLRYHIIKKIRKGTAVSIYPSWECNYQCDYCLLRTHGEFPKSDILSFESWKGYLIDLDIALCNSGAHGIKEICLLGGEPTLLPYFADLCNWILHKQRWQLMVYTNLSNLKTLEIKPSILLRIEATYHYKALPGKFTERHKIVNKIHRVIPRELMVKDDQSVLSYTHKDFMCIEPKDVDIACPPYLRVGPDQNLVPIYSTLSKLRVKAPKDSG